MPETLLAPTSVRLYGRVVEGLTIEAGKAFPADGSFLGGRLTATGMDTLARIYGFSYEGHYYDLAKPALFLVNGAGDPASPAAPFGQDKDGNLGGVPAPVENEAEHPARPVATGPSRLERSGIPAKAWEFSSDMRVWTFDRSDLSIRLDIDSGDFERILLQAEVMGSGGAYGGSHAHGGSHAYGGSHAHGGSHAYGGSHAHGGSHARMRGNGSGD